MPLIQPQLCHRYLAVSATLPMSIAEDRDNLGLCVAGCPPSEMLDTLTTTAMPQKKVTKPCTMIALMKTFPNCLELLNIGLHNRSLFNRRIFRSKA